MDFLPVERVLQISSPSGAWHAAVARAPGGLATRRAGHRAMTVVPAHSLELVDAGGGAQRGARRAAIEARESPDKPLDVLVQHLVTVALGGSFRAEDLLAEVRTTVGLPRPGATRSGNGAWTSCGGAGARCPPIPTITAPPR